MTGEQDCVKPHQEHIEIDAPKYVLYGSLQMNWTQRIADAEGFQWDDGNATKSLFKHHVTPAEGEEVLKNRPLLLSEDVKHSHAEERGHALGRTDEGRLLHLSFTIRNNRIRIISARPMNHKEKAVYEKN